MPKPGLNMLTLFDVNVRYISHSPCTNYEYSYDKLESSDIYIMFLHCFQKEVKKILYVQLRFLVKGHI